MNKIALAIVTLGLVVFLGVIFLGGSGLSNGQNIEIKDGVQYIRINAKGGYTPKVSIAKAGIPTKLVMATNGTYDCSAALVVRAVNFQKILPQNGETEIDLGILKAGETIDGVCGMGMYSFKINVEI